MTNQERSLQHGQKDKTHPSQPPTPIPQPPLATLPRTKLNYRMERLRDFAEGIYFSLPVQLLVVQVRYQKFSLLCWLLLFLAATNSFGSSFGIPYLFLEPEYLGKSDLFGMFLMGCGLGTFITSYMMASYISNGYRFDFLAMEYRPFFIFYLNNLLIPIAFVATYSTSYLRFQSILNGGFQWESVGRLGGLYLGLFLVTVLIILYFFGTNRSLVHVLGEKVVKEMRGGRAIIKKARAGLRRKRRIDYYISGLFRIDSPDPEDRADLRQLVQILNQNHGNALFLQLILLIVITCLGLLETNPDFLIPAGMSILLLLSVLLMLMGAMTFWTRRLGPVAVLVLLVGYALVDHFTLNKFRHPALGMNYEVAPAPYTTAALRAASSEQFVRDDIETTTRMLNQWRSDYAVFHGPYKKPKAVIICTSGGGLRASYYTTRVLQIADSLGHGSLLNQTRLITGASGGMVGAAYYRELFLRKAVGDFPKDHPLWDPRLVNPLGRDLLNRVCFKIVTGLFLPTAREQVGGATYLSDRGWSFDDQLATNIPYFRNRRITDYSDYEEQALIPQMILSPVIINDGRKLYISSLPVSYLCRNFNYDGTRLLDGITGVDLRRFFHKQEADSLLFTTALRMNASFPFITPYVRMPSEPPIQVMDAGLADNYGLETAARYLNHFAKWFNDYTDGVLLLQIRDSKSQSMDVPTWQSASNLSQMLDPIGGTYSAYYATTDLMNDQYLHQIDQSLKGKLEFACFEYASRDSGSLRASLSWHLTAKEVQAIESVIADSANQAAFRTVKDWLKDE